MLPGPTRDREASGLQTQTATVHDVDPLAKSFRELVLSQAVAVVRKTAA
jgi:hypothetical protein